MLGHPSLLDVWLEKELENGEEGLQEATKDEGRLVSLLRSLVVGVERGIERIPVDELVVSWACPHPLTSTQISKSWGWNSGNEDSGEEEVDSRPMSPLQPCTCHLTIEKKDSGIQTSPFEAMVDAIPHIDSDSGSGSEDEPDTSKSTKRRDNRAQLTAAAVLACQENLEIKQELGEEKQDFMKETYASLPNSISELTEEVLFCGITLPGFRDASGHPVVTINACELNSSHSALNPTDIARLLLYYQEVPRKEDLKSGLTLLIHDEVNKSVVNILEQAVEFAKDQLRVSAYFVWPCRPNCCHNDGFQHNLPSFVRCQKHDNENKWQVISNRGELEDIFPVLPKQCGGEFEHNQQQWTNFQRAADLLRRECAGAARGLVSVLASLRAASMTAPTSPYHARQQIEQQRARATSALEEPSLRKLQKDGNALIANLETQASTLTNTPDVRFTLGRCRLMLSEVERAAQRLTQLAERRLVRLRDYLLRRAAQEEAAQVLSWLCEHGETTLKKHNILSDTLPAVQQQEVDFDKFHFVAMRHIERGKDLLDESALGGCLVKTAEGSQSGGENGATTTTSSSNGQTAGLKDLARSLRHHIRSFSDRLEDTRERVEDASRCYHLLDKAFDWAINGTNHVSEMKLDQCSTTLQVQQQLNQLQHFLEVHPPISQTVFDEMIQLAKKLANDKLVEQCKIAQARCEEAYEQIQSRQEALLQLKKQLEESKVVPVLDCAIEEWPVVLPRERSWACVPASSTVRRSSCHAFGSNASASGCGAGTAHHVGTGPSSNWSGCSCGSGSGRRQSAPGRKMSDGCNVVPDMDSSLSMMMMMSTALPVTLDYPAEAAFLKAKDRSSIASASHSTSSFSSCSDCSGGSSGGSAPRKGVVHGCSSSSRSGSVNGTQRRPACGWTYTCGHQNHHHVRGKLAEDTELQEEDIANPADASLNHNDDHQSTTNAPSKTLSPVPVNTHLLQQTSLITETEVSSSQTDDEKLTEAQMKTNKTLLHIMREMIQTERDYVRSLEYVIEHYIPELTREDIPQALRGQRNVVFGNIEKIYEFHRHFFLHELENCEMDPFSVGHCFLRHESYFYLYALYNKNKPKSDSLMMEYGNTFFKGKQLQLNDKMDLASYLLKPVQRMGKYALLLKQVLKECAEKKAEYSDLKSAEEMVRFQLRHGNDLLAMDSLRDCDINVKEQGRLLRQNEFLVWQGKGKKCLRHVFLFEELILFSKARRDPERKNLDVYIYKNSIKMTDIGLTAQSADSNTKFEIWFRKRKLHDTYILQAMSPDIKNAWAKELSRLLWKQALRNREMRMAEMSSMGIGNKPCFDIKPSEDQISDRSISVAQLCKAPRFRNSIAIPPGESLSSNKRPHSIISVSSSSSGSSQSSYPLSGTLNLGFDPHDSPKPCHRSITLHSQCSTESGIIADMSLTYDDLDASHSHKHVGRSNSTATSISADSLSASLPTSPVSPLAMGPVRECEDTSQDTGIEEEIEEEEEDDQVVTSV